MMQTRTVLLARRSLLAQARPVSRAFATSTRLREYQLFLNSVVVFGASREQVLLAGALSVPCDQDEANARVLRKCAEDRRFTTSGRARWR